MQAQYATGCSSTKIYMLYSILVENKTDLIDTKEAFWIYNAIWILRSRDEKNF